MSAELTDADLEGMAAAYDWHRGNREVAAALRELIALRARREQDTPSDPAATLENAHAVYHCEAGNLFGEDDCGWERCRFWDVATDLIEQGWRAPGVVAAAPTEDEVAVSRADLRAVLALVETYDEGCLANTTPETERLTAALAVPPAPSAGEDEAAVERAKAAAVGVAVAGYFDEQRAAGADITPQWVRDHSADIHAVAAAARGPRTQDDA